MLRLTATNLAVSPCESLSSAWGEAGGAPVGRLISLEQHAHWTAHLVDAAVTLLPKGLITDCSRCQTTTIQGSSKVGHLTPHH